MARRFAFEEVDAPMVEHAALFTRKAGEEIVVGQSGHGVVPSPVGSESVCWWDRSLPTPISVLLESTCMAIPDS